MKLNKWKMLTSSLYATSIAASMQIVLADGPSTGIPTQVSSVVTNILNGISAVGVIVAVGMIIYAGFKFLTAGAGEKAKAKDMLVPLIVGAALVALAGPIANWVWGLVGGSGTVSEGT